MAAVSSARASTAGGLRGLQILGQSSGHSGGYGGSYSPRSSDSSGRPRATLPRPEWRPDHTVSACEEPGCCAPFTLLNRRHHCRGCGGLFCNECTGVRIALPQLGYHKDTPQRVCAECAAVALEALSEARRCRVPSLNLAAAVESE